MTTIQREHSVHLAASQPPKKLANKNSNDKQVEKHQLHQIRQTNLHSHSRRPTLGLESNELSTPPKNPGPSVSYATGTRVNEDSGYSNWNAWLGSSSWSWYKGSTSVYDNSKDEYASGTNTIIKNSNGKITGFAVPIKATDSESYGYEFKNRDGTPEYRVLVNESKGEIKSFYKDGEAWVQLSDNKAYAKPEYTSRDIVQINDNAQAESVYDDSWNAVKGFINKIEDGHASGRATGAIINELKSKFIQNKYAEHVPGEAESTGDGDLHVYPIYDSKNNHWGLDLYFDPNGEEGASPYHRFLYDEKANVWLEWKHDGDDWVFHKSHSVS